MRFLFTEEQKLFQRTAREFLEKECPPEHVRAMAADGTGRSPELWRSLAELGVVGVTVPKRFGGLGGDEVDLVLLLEEAGRAALPEPLVETTAVAVPMLCEAAAEETQAEWLPRVARGEAILTTLGIEGVPLIDAHIAAIVIIRAAEGLVAVPPSELHLTRQPSIDATRRLFTFKRASEGPVTVLSSGAAADSALEAAFDRGALATAAVLCGITDRVIESASVYARERHQFGVPIGSFQAVKHLLADALLRLDFARPLVYRAAWSVAHAHPDRARDVSMAKAYASDAAVDACRVALQVHGAVGYTHEHDLHLWLNKGFALANAWGTAAWHRDRVALAVLG